MTSERKLRANRANAQASTGPRTPRGKARASQNARSHGLSVFDVLDPVLSEKVESFARRIVSDGFSSEIKVLVRRIAETQIAIEHIREVRQAYLRDRFPPKEIAKLATQEESVRLRSDLTKILVAIDRYERRALSRRKFAIRELDLARREIDPKETAGDV